MVQLITIAAAFIFTLFMVLSGIADIQDNLGEYRRQLDAEGFEGLTIGYINQSILKEGGLYPFLRKHCAVEKMDRVDGVLVADPNAVQFNPAIRQTCLLSETDQTSIFKLSFQDGRMKTNTLRSLQDLEVLPADSSEIEFKFTLKKPASVIWQFEPLSKDTKMMTISFLEVEASVYLMKKTELIKVFTFNKVFRP